jgi:hypothetical protein
MASDSQPDRAAPGEADDADDFRASMGISGRTTKRFIEGLPGREPPAPGEPETDPLLTDSLGTTFTLIAPGVWQSQDSGVTYTVRFPSPAAPLPAGARPSGTEDRRLDLLFSQFVLAETRCNDADDAGRFSQELAEAAAQAQATLVAHIDATSRAAERQRLAGEPDDDLRMMFTELANQRTTVGCFRIEDAILARFAALRQQAGEEKAEADRWCREAAKQEKETRAYKLDHEDLKERLATSEAARAETAALTPLARLGLMTLDAMRHDLYTYPNPALVRRAACENGAAMSLPDTSTLVDTPTTVAARALLARPATEEGT